MPGRLLEEIAGLPQGKCERFWSLVSGNEGILRGDSGECLIVGCGCGWVELSCNWYRDELELKETPAVFLFYCFFPPSVSRIKGGVFFFFFFFFLRLLGYKGPCVQIIEFRRPLGILY